MMSSMSKRPGNGSPVLYLRSQSTRLYFEMYQSNEILHLGAYVVEEGEGYIQATHHSCGAISYARICVAGSTFLEQVVSMCSWKSIV